MTAPAVPANGEGEPITTTEQLEVLAATLDAQALADLSGQPAKPEDGAAGAVSSPKPGASTDPVDVFIQQNYKGDRNAFLQAQYEARAENKRLATELEAARKDRTVSTPRDPAAEFKAALEQSPDVLAVNQEIRTIDVTQKGIEARQLELAQLVQPIANEIAVLERDLVREDDPTKRSEIASKLTDQRSKLTSLDHEWQMNDGRHRNNQMLRNSQIRELRRLESDVKKSMDEEARAQEAAASGGEQASQDFDEAFRHHIKSYSITNEEQVKGLEYFTGLAMADFLADRGDRAGLDSAGIHTAVGKMLASVAATFNVAKRTTTPGRAPAPRQPLVLQPRIVVPGSPVGASTDPAKNPLKDADYVRKRADALIRAAQGGPVKVRY